MTGNQRIKTHLARVPLIVLVVLVLPSLGYAQKVTFTPSSVDTTKPAKVTVSVTKADNTSDKDLIAKVKKITVDKVPVTPTASGPDALTFDPPTNLTPGQKSALLFDEKDNQIAAGELQYSGTSASTDNQTSVVGLTADQARAREQARYDVLAHSYWYYLLVSFMFAAVLIPFVAVIFLGTRESRKRVNLPLGLPTGSFRSILAYSLVAYVGFYVLTSVLSVSPFAPPEFLLGIVASVIGFYFGSGDRADDKASATASAVRGTVLQGTSPAPGALVEFTRAADGVKLYSRIADLTGRFALTGAASGKYAVQASLTGSAPSDVMEITLADGADREVQIVIKPTSPGPLPGPIVPAPGPVVPPAGPVVAVPGPVAPGPAVPPTGPAVPPTGTKPAP